MFLFLELGGKCDEVPCDGTEEARENEESGAGAWVPYVFD